MKLFKDMNQEEAEAHILKFKQHVQAAKPPHNMPLWHDISVFFVELFTEKPHLEAIYYADSERLINDLQRRFNGTYDGAHIAKMLYVEYKVVNGLGYEFAKSDFIKPVTK